MKSFTVTTPRMLDAKLVRQSRYGVLLIHEQDPRPAASRHYEPGTRTGVWLKVKNVHRQEFVIGGWIPGERRRSGGLGSVIVADYQDDKIISAGGVGPGLTNQILVELAKLLAASRIHSAARCRRRRARGAAAGLRGRVRRVDNAVRRAEASVVQGTPDR